ncbi:MAG: NUDIX domain-containing protein [Actinomycetota bacterium]
MRACYATGVGAWAGEELVDVVDPHDVVIDTVTRAEMRARRLRHLAVSIAVMGGDGRLLVHRRADTKDVWPGWWDIAAGGVVAAGEDYDAAARRELAEELGINVDTLEHLGKASYEDDEVALMGCGYLCRHDGPFEFTDGEITEVRWVTRSELDSMIANERFVPDNIALLLPLLSLR